MASDSIQDTNPTIPNSSKSTEIEETSPSTKPKLMIESYFPTLIAFQDWLDVISLNTYLKEQIYAWKAKDLEGIERSNVRSMGAWHSKTDMNQRPEFAEFTERVTLTVQEYFNQLGYDPSWKASCDSMWANISPKYAYNRSHNHGSTLCSGVYYVQSDPGHSGRINFTDPREQAVILPTYTKEALQRSHTWSNVYYDPIPGRIILFPGWLRHDVAPNLYNGTGKEADRISISFNFYQCPPDTVRNY
ncbi:TIGR02466 family protein [Dapis sp. BLCC M126]|uniref:TIGR02466 family protein n=1 Tax=Dapis sp. BLCC M126 TaxID=3400189 RepID=UPI003CF32EC5